MFYLTTHSTHSIYGYKVEDHSYNERGNPPKPQHWLLFSDLGWGGGGEGLNYFRAHIHRRFRHAYHETRDRHPGLGSRGRGFPISTDRIACTTAFVTSVVEHEK